jgi:DNA-binding IclR family transcriptional regulator
MEITMNDIIASPFQANQSSDKLLTILEFLAEQPEPVRLQDLAELCSMYPSTALRFLTTLRNRGYVAQETESGKYYLTLKICSLAQRRSAQIDVRNIAFPFMRSIANLFTESCNLAVQKDLTVIYIEVANVANKALMSTQRIGSAAPMHCTGIGKLFLSEYTSAELDAYCQVKGLDKYTEYTLTNKSTLLQDLEEIQSLGYAFDNQECELGVRCIAVPIRDFTGRIIAGLSISGPNVRMTNEHIYSHLQNLLDAGNQISIYMGYQRL